MGLFSKVTCSICGKQTRFSKTKLADGNYICTSCYIGSRYLADSFLGVKVGVKHDMKELTLEDVNSLYEIRRQNLNEVQNFKCTTPLGKNMVVDEDAGKIIFEDYLSYTQKKGFLKKNPYVFNVENLALIHTIFSETETSQTITGKAKAESKAYLILGFEDPVYDIVKVEIGKLTAKSGILFDKVKGVSKIEDIRNTIEKMRDKAITKAEANNVLIPANSADSFWKLLSEASYNGYVTSREVKEYLKQYCGNDRNMIKEIKATYNLK